MQQESLGGGVPDVSSNSLVIRYHSVSSGNILIINFSLLFPSLYGQGHDSHRERDLFYTTRCHSCFSVKIQMSGSEHYPLLSNSYRWLAVQFCSSAELNPKEHFQGSKAVDLAPAKCAVIFNASCLREIL